MGRPQVGGPFTLQTHDGRTLTEADLRGKWSFVYFGFSNCPDICPAELDKLSTILSSLEKSYPDASLLPLFISVDPARDTPAQLRTYLADFHPSIVGLVGSYADTRAVCKAYRVYFSTPPDADPKGDYLVDHSIYVYLMDPRGQFVEAFGQATDAKEVVERVEREMEAYKAETGGLA